MKTFHHSVKVKSVDQVQPGTILVSQGFWNDEVLQRSVVLILEHDEFGSTGIMLNKLSNLKVNEALPGIEVDESLLYGGAFNTNRVGFIHKVKSLSNAIRITDELYWGGNIYQLQKLISSGVLKPEDVRFVAGFTEWKGGELVREIEENKWWIDDFELDELFKMEYSTLWAYKLLNAGHVYGLFYEIADPCLN